MNATKKYELLSQRNEELVKARSAELSEALILHVLSVIKYFIRNQ